VQFGRTAYGVAVLDQETDPSGRNKILRLIFEQVTVEAGRTVSVTPRDAILPYFQFGYANGG